MKLKLATLGLFLATHAFAGTPEESVKADEVSVMTFNVENLFDTEQDNAEDYTYLPLSKKNTKEHQAVCAKIQNDYFRDECNSLDWNENVLSTKIDRIVNVITSIDGGVGPDILILPEVENVKVLGRLMKEINKRIPSKKAYREPILLEGWDGRGIDVGMLSRLKRAGETKIYPVKMNGKILDSRGIQHAIFKLPDGEKLNVFGVHFPSGGNPVVMREAAVDALNAEIKKLPAGSLSIAGGDFNINSNSDAKFRLYEDRLGSKWLVSHLIGCNHCLGTEFYGKEQSWSFLDALLFSLDMKTGTRGWIVDDRSIDTPNNGPEQTWKGKPNRFSVEHGVSDHWPVYAKIRKK